MVEGVSVVGQRIRGKMVDNDEVVGQRKYEFVWKSDEGCVVHGEKLVKDV